MAYLTEFGYLIWCGCVHVQCMKDCPFFRLFSVMTAVMVYEYFADVSGLL